MGSGRFWRCPVSGDVRAYIGGLREDLGRAEERIRELEDRQAALLRVLREAAARHEAVRAAGLAGEPYLPVSEELVEVLAELADAIEGTPCPCGEGTGGDCPGAWRGCDWHDEPEEYDPGPEADDEGGMSEYRHAAATEGEPW